MFIQTIRLAVIAAAITIAAPAFAQDCGCGGGQLGYGGGGQTGFGGSEVGQPYFGFNSPANCGRGITQQQAEGLWAGYCNENCGYAGGGSAGGGCKLRGRHGLGGGGGCGCNSGCFGYPTGGGCGGGGCQGGGCKLGSRHGGGCKLKGLHGGGCGAGCKLKGLHGGGNFGSSQFAGYNLGASHFAGGGSCGGGCGGKLKGHGCGKLKGHGCGGKLKGLHGGCGGCKLFGGCKKFSSSAQQCGTSGAYFSEAVGYEYGTSGIESCVSCNSCGSFDSLVPAMAAPIAQPFSAPLQSVPVAEPVVGAIGALN